MAEYTAVLADDVPELRLMTQLALEGSGRFDVVATADNGVAATEAARLHRPDLVLLDISMPVQDGLEALPHIRAASPTSKIVMLTGFEADRLAPVAMEMGATAYIEKGTPPKILVQSVLRAMSESGEQLTPRSLGRRKTDQNRVPVVSPDELLSMVGHEFRQPLAVIHGFGLTLAERWDTLSDLEKRDIVGRMTTNATYLDAVLTNVIQLAAGGDVLINTSGHAPDALVKALADEMQMISKNHPIREEIDPDLPRVLVDPQRLRQVITNLVVNATKFAPTETPITIAAHRHAGGVTISVSDQGPGIPAERRTAMFARFAKADPKSKGLGLGLFISRSMMHAMSGDIWIEDGTTGTTVTCLLPLESVA